MRGARKGRERGVSREEGTTAHGDELSEVLCVSVASNQINKIHTSHATILLDSSVYAIVCHPPHFLHKCMIHPSPRVRRREAHKIAKLNFGERRGLAREAGTEWYVSRVVPTMIN